MREQLIQYVQLLFAGAADCDDTRQEILQNTLDRYDDLIAAGKTPEAAYRLAIMGIGDINEILGRTSGTPAVMPVPAVSQEKQDTPTKKILRAIGVGLYILCPLPLFSDGLCGTLIFIAIATALVILGAKKEGSESKSGTAENTTPETELKKSVSGLIWAIGLAVYFLVSFLTGSWYITWVIFPITAAVQGLVKAILDLKEGK